MFETGVAYAAGAATAGGPGGIMSILPLVLIFGVFYFLIIRPQQKKAKEQQDFLGALKKGDTVVSGGGIHGTITGLTDTVVTLEIADNVRIKVSRQVIMGPIGSGGKDDSCSKGGG